MKPKVATLLFVLLMVHTSIDAQTKFDIKESTLSIQGTSTVHDWTSSTATITGNGHYTITANLLTGLDGEIKILVAGIKSTKGKTMDNKTYDAFHYEKYPYITFKLISEKIDAAKSLIDIKGNLSMAGMSRMTDLSLTYNILPGGDLVLHGSKKIKMTDFKMEPPTAMMGTIKVGDEVTIDFDITLTPHKII